MYGILQDLEEWLNYYRDMAVITCREDCFCFDTEAYITKLQKYLDIENGD